MKQTTHTLFFYFLVLTILMAPFSFAYAGLIPCGDTGNADCTFADLFKLIANIIDFLLFKLAVPLAAIAFAWAGILLLTDGGNEGKRKQAKEIIKAAGIGLAFALAAWLIVNTIFTTLTTIQITPTAP